MSMMNLSLHWNDAPLRRVAVASWEDASRVFCTDRERGAYGASQMRGNCGVITRNRNVVAYVSYNGRVWKGKPSGWTKDSTPLFDPCGPDPGCPPPSHISVDRDSFEWLLDHAMQDRETYLDGGSAASDYGDELTEWANQEAARCAAIARLATSAGLHGVSEKYIALSHRFMSTAEEA